MRKSNKDCFKVEYSNKDIINLIDNNHKQLVCRLEAIELQTTRTNGRVTALENANKILIGAICTIGVTIVIAIITKLI